MHSNPRLYRNPAKCWAWVSSGWGQGAQSCYKTRTFLSDAILQFSHFLFLFFVHYHSPGRACCLFVHFSAVGVFAGCAFFFSFSFPFKMKSSSWQTLLVTVYSSFLILAGIFVFISRLGGDFAPFAASSPQPLEPASPRLTLNVVLSSNSLPSSSLTCGDGTHVEERKAWQAAHAKYAGSERRQVHVSQRSTPFRLVAVLLTRTAESSCRHTSVRVYSTPP